MKGVNFVTNEKQEIVAVQIELKELQKNQESIEDYLDGVIAQSRAGIETIDWQSAKDELKASGKL